MKIVEHAFVRSLAFAIVLFAGVYVAQAQDRPDSTDVGLTDLLERARESTIRARERSADERALLFDALSEGERLRGEIFAMRLDQLGRDTLAVDFDRVTRMARRHMPDLRRNLRRFEFERMMDESSVVVEMEKEARELSRRARAAEGSERRQLEAELRTHLESLMQEKLAHEERVLERRRTRLEEESRRLQERRERRTDIIERRFRDLLGERDVLEW